MKGSTGTKEKKTAILAVSLSGSDKELVEEFSEKYGVTMAAVARMAVKKFIRDVKAAGCENLIDYMN